LLRVLPLADLLVLDDSHRVVFVGPDFAKEIEVDTDELIGVEILRVLPSWTDVTNPMTAPTASPDGPASSVVGPTEVSVVKDDDREIAVRILVAMISLDARSWTLVLVGDPPATSGHATTGLLDDVRTAQLNAAVVLSESEERFRHSFEDNMAPMMFTDADDRIILVNDAFCHMIGWTRDELLHSDSTPFTFPEDIGISETTHRRLTTDSLKQARYVKRYLHRDGRIVIVEISKSAAFDVNGVFLYFVISERDITEERALSAQLTHQALHDPLTGLANRAVFEDRLHQAQARLLRHGGFSAVLLMDLDDFKGVNDTHGHVIGDQLLTSISRRLENETRSSDTLCRFGGDEFLYLAEGLNSAEEAEQLAIRLQRVVAQPVEMAGTQLEIRTSIGVVVWDGSDTEYTQIIQNADSAMYEAKRRGKGNYVIFTAKLQQQAINRFALTQELRQAIHGGELSMYFQPILELATGDVVGFEALMRWQHPQRGFVPPSVFIALAEQSDLILDLGSFALNESVRAASMWSPTPSGRLPFVTVNFSTRQFHDSELMTNVVDALMVSGLDPKRLIIEITEGVTLLDVAETLHVIDQLHRLEIGIALDDFGTGYSSLSYLTLLHPTIIKIDRSFVSPTNENAHNDTLLQTIVSLGRKLNMTVLAEGIETKQQLGRLRELGCDLGQGFLFSPAVALPEVQALMDVGFGF